MLPIVEVLNICHEILNILCFLISNFILSIKHISSQSFVWLFLIQHQNTMPEQPSLFDFSLLVTTSSQWSNYECLTF